MIEMALLWNFVEFYDVLDKTQFHINLILKKRLAEWKG